MKKADTIKIFPSFKKNDNVTFKRNEKDLTGQVLYQCSNGMLEVKVGSRSFILVWNTNNWKTIL